MVCHLSNNGLSGCHFAQSATFRKHSNPSFVRHSACKLSGKRHRKLSCRIRRSALHCNSFTSLGVSSVGRALGFAMFDYATGKTRLVNLQKAIPACEAGQNLLRSRFGPHMEISRWIVRATIENVKQPARKSGEPSLVTIEIYLLLLSQSGNLQPSIQNRMMWAVPGVIVLERGMTRPRVCCIFRI